jgi:hypothetical protein
MSEDRKPKVGSHWREKTRSGRIVEVMVTPGYYAERVLVKSITTHNVRLQSFPSLVVLRTFRQRFEPVSPEDDA